MLVLLTMDYTYTCCFWYLEIGALLSHVVRFGNMSVHVRRKTILIRHSFVHQRHSFSRLNLTEYMFNALMNEFHIFPRFKEFVLLFGSKRRDSEIGVPQLRFRHLLVPASKPLEHDCVGFGNVSMLAVVNALRNAYTSRMRLWSQVRRIE